MNITKSIGRFAIVALIGLSLGAIVCNCVFPGIIPPISDVFSVPFPG